MSNHNPESIARTRHEEARVEAISAFDESRRWYRYGVAVARKYGHADLLPRHRPGHNERQPQA